MSVHCVIYQEVCNTNLLTVLDVFIGKNSDEARKLEELEE